jgi:uncharacterized protein (DUF58 family)
VDRRELLRKITTFPLAASLLAEDLLAGDFRSVFRGQGIEFDEARRYEPGDDIRSIDWNASARFGVPFVKMYREERELTVLIVLDTSASMFSGGSALKWTAGGVTLPSRYEQGLLAAALIAFSAERTGQRLGALFFDREVDRVFPPRKGRRHTMAVLSGALQFQDGRRPPSRGSNLGAALAGAGRLLKRRSLVVVVSDFFCLNWDRELGNLARNHDVIALRIRDPLDGELPDLGLIPLEDPETGVRFHAPTGFPSFRTAWARWHEDREQLWASLCRRAGAACLDISTAGDAAQSLFHFFGGRYYQGRSRRNSGYQRKSRREGR